MSRKVFLMFILIFSCCRGGESKRNAGRPLYQHSQNQMQNFDMGQNHEDLNEIFQQQGESFPSFPSKPKNQGNLFDQRPSDISHHNLGHELLNAGQTHEDPFIGQTHEDPFIGQTHEDPFIGQTHENPFIGQTHEDPFIGQSPLTGQQHEDFNFGRQQHGQQYENLNFGQIPETGQIHQENFDNFNFGGKPKFSSRGDQLPDSELTQQSQTNLLDDFGKIKTEEHSHQVDDLEQQFVEDPFPLQDDQGQQLVFPGFPGSSIQKPGAAFKGGCNSRPPTPINAVLKCSLYSGCKATCLKGYEFSTGDLTMFMTCKGGQWKIAGDTWEVVPPCKPICLPGCQHNGICIAPNQCQCPKNFGGPQCQFEKKPCLNYPPLPANSVRSCTSKSCTVTCAKGFEFPDGSTITNMLCKDGQWRLSRTDWVSLPDCRAICSPPCINGGTCLTLNVCQCPQQFTGSQCQYEMSACSGSRLNFNGKYNCTGNGERLVCELKCPPGIESTTPLAEDYTCLYSTGQFLPQPIPTCVYGDDVLVVQLNTTSNVYYSASQVERGTYHHRTPGGGKKGKQVAWDIVSLFETDYNKPTPGECNVWGSTHLKNFDGGLYSFDSPCSFTLARDIRDGAFEIILDNAECISSQCHRSIQILYQNTVYKIYSKDDVAQLTFNGNPVPIPTQLVGFTVEARLGYTHITLHSLDISVEWNGMDYVSVALSENMWNRTGGLCGNINKVANDDFLTKSGVAARSLESFLDSWSVGDGETACLEPAKVSSSCANNVTQSHCDLIINDPHFASCREVVNSKPFYDACLWDYCKCGAACSCPAIAAFVRQCKLYLDNPSPNWRAIAECPFKCPSSKVYSCGPVTQPSCGDIQTEMLPIEVTPNEELNEPVSCVEGCFCPQGTVSDGENCIDRELCPCKLRGKTFPSGSTIPKGCNTCSCNKGLWTCTEVRCSARCSSVGDPHYVTFDGRRFDFMGQCSYHLIKADNYSIDAENVPCSGAISRNMNLLPGPDVPSCTKTITIKFGSRVVLLKQNAQVYVNGEEVNHFPHQDEGFSIRAVSSLFLIVALDNGVDVWWDGVTSVYVDAPASLQDQTKGLCGTFNLNQKDDFLTPEGDVEQAVVPFANKWKTEEGCIEVVDKPVPHVCDRDPVLKEKAIAHCSKLRSSIFEACHWHVDVEPFYQNCIYDLCSCSGNEKSCLCPVLADYASQCAREGVHIVWRTDVRECGLHCPSGQTYQACGNTCARSCLDLALFPDCHKSCVEGCNCPQGQTLDSTGACIPISQCSCLHHNREHVAGSQLVLDNYKGPQFCTCINAVWDCRPATSDEAAKHSEILEIKSSCLARRNEEFTYCEPAETVTCKNMHNPPQHTPAKCSPGCVCKKGFVWDSLGKKCLRGNECPCHHGGVSYENGSSIQEDCNTCTCSGGQWICTDRACPAVCSTWGDSHFKTFDGRIFDFQGSCDFLLTGGALSDLDVFDIKIQIVPCGTSGVSCPKSVTLKVGRKENVEEVVLTKGRALPLMRELARIAVRDAGIFVFVEVFDLGLVLQWDRGTRIYVTADPRWRNKVKGLCGNMNNDAQDDLSTPSGGISEVSSVLFADSWRLHQYCPDSSEIIVSYNWSSWEAHPVQCLFSQNNKVIPGSTAHCAFNLAVRDTCEKNPNRRSWANSKCGILKSPIFEGCHSEVPLDPFFTRCIVDTCGCDEGGDCECLCAAVAAYAHECSLRGVPIKWRSQDVCPLQCDHPGSRYSSCVSPCPVKTCDNVLIHNDLTQICGQESCVEGCQGPMCPDGEIFTNSSLLECVSPSVCKTTCLTVDNITYFEGDLMEGDECHSCFCSRHKKACAGVPCTTSTTRTTTIIATTTSTEEPIPTLINDGSPTCVDGWTSWINLDHPLQPKKKTDYESLPTSNLLLLVGSSSHCNESQMADIRCRDSWSLTNYKETGFDVECSLERGFRCESNTVPCPDFEISVLCECRNAITTSTTISTTLSTTTLSTTTTTTKQVCPSGEKWVECAIPCDRTCHFFGHYLVSRGLCTSPHSCIPGCQPDSWKPCQGNEWLRDGQTCVQKRDCTCRSDSGDIVKPGSIFHESECGKCQCVNSGYECDFSGCFEKRTLPPSTTPSTRMDQNLLNVTLPGVWLKEFGNVTLIYLSTPSTITPPRQCYEERYHSLMRGNSNVRLESSSDRDINKTAVKGQLEYATGGWTAGRENLDQYLQVDLGEVQAVYGVVVAGDSVGHFVTSYRLLYSIDGVSYRYVLTPDSITEVFRGAIDGIHPVKLILANPFEARFIRFNPFTWNGAMSMRVDVLGCGGEVETTTEWVHLVTNPSPMCDDPMGLDSGNIPLTSIIVSSAKPGHGPETLRLSGNSAWKPLTSSQSEFVTIDLLGPKNITGIVMKGMPEGNDIDALIPESWVESYRLLYSADGFNWNPILDTHEKEKTFLGNFDGDSSRKNLFDLPIKARFIKLIPLTWRHEISLRLEILGCYEPNSVITNTPPPVPLSSTCDVCPGVESLASCPCSSGDWWDGEGCTSRAQCPCMVGHIPYAVGIVFHKEKCEECTCRLNGVASCEPKSCPVCPHGLRSKLTPSCGCICKPCEKGTQLCPTSGVCIAETAWCDGVKDCPDDENNCTSYVEEPRISCNASCPPGYSIIFTSEPQEVEIIEKGFSKKGMSAKGVKSSKGTKRPLPVKIRNPTICPAYECLPMPTIPPTECPQPVCPLNFSVDKKDTELVMPSACPRYFCRPPRERATCSLSGRTFTTFDGIEYKYDICDHILTTDLLDGNWNVSVFKTCHTMAPCSIALVINHDGSNLIFMEGSNIQVGGFSYSSDQIEVINSRTTKFNVNHIGDSWIFKSNIYGFKVVYDGRGNVRVEVDGTSKGGLSGLCGLYNGHPDDDKSRPDGSISISTNDFGHSWMTPGSGQCETKVCPVEVQEQALQLCYLVKKEPFTVCEGVLNTNQFISRCLESTCNCLQSNKTSDECRCAALLDFVSSCKNNDMTRDLAGWRLTHDCVASCPSDMTFHDCYPYSCEASCEESSCFSPATACFSGCFCGEGLVRRGDTCVKPSDCRDCTCDGLGDSQYLSFDRQNITFTGNCTYVAARDVPESNVPNFQVIVTNAPCRVGENSQCTQKVAIYTRSHNVEMIAVNENKVTLTVDGAEIPDSLNTSWVVAEIVPGGAIHVFMTAYSLLVTFKYPKFSISLPSHTYQNRTEGLCGNCNKDPSDEDRISSELADAWLVKHLSTNCITPMLNCGNFTSEPERCNIIQDVNIFGRCHALVDPETYVDICVSHQCYNGSVCESVEAYAKACRDVGVCIDWRNNTFCPLQCPKGLEYQPCAPGCPLTCDNYLKFRSEDCPFQNVEGCFCPENHILINSSCLESSWCETCDKAGHRSGDSWTVDKCTNCSCNNRTVSCTHESCPAIDSVCPEGHSAILDSSKPADCCPQYICNKPLCSYESDHGKPSTHEVGSQWADGPCKNCVCLINSSKAEASCTTQECMSIENHPDRKEFDLRPFPSNNSCCPDIMRVGCKEPDGHVYLIGESWFPKSENRCLTYQCVMTETGLLVKEQRTEQCNTKCDYGWEYHYSNDTCCGKCVQTGCVLGDKFYKPGELWSGPDNCTTFSCLHVLGGYLVNSETEQCPDLTNCPVEDRYQAGCCSRCKISTEDLSNCAPTELPTLETVELVQEYQTYHGKCVNVNPVPKFTQCTGACDSRTVYNKATWGHDNVCLCCQPKTYSKVVVPLTCQDGYVIEKTISVPSKCQCQSCGGP